MSHIVEVQTQVKSLEGVQAACARLALPPPRVGSAQLFAATVSGIVVELPQWRYPVVFDPQQGTARYDIYGGAWGDPGQLQRFLQAYACETAKLAARQRGHTVSETTLADGAIRLTIAVGGAA